MVMEVSFEVMNVMEKELSLASLESPPSLGVPQKVTDRY